MCAFKYKPTKLYDRIYGKLGIISALKRMRIFQLLDEISSYDSVYSRVPRHVWTLGERGSENQCHYFPFSGSSIDSSSTFAVSFLVSLHFKLRYLFFLP